MFVCRISSQMNLKSDRVTNKPIRCDRLLIQHTEIRPHVQVKLFHRFIICLSQTHQLHSAVNMKIYQEKMMLNKTFVTICVIIMRLKVKIIRQKNSWIRDEKLKWDYYWLSHIYELIWEKCNIKLIFNKINFHSFIFNLHLIYFYKLYQ